MSWVSDQQELHITIGSLPHMVTEGPTKRPDFENELRMIKAGLLYADHTKLCSFTSSSLMSLLTVTQITEEKRVEFLKEMRSWPGLDPATIEKADNFLELYEQATRRRYSKRGHLLLKQLNEELEENWRLSKQMMDGVISEVKGDGIVEAASSGLLEVHKFKGVESIMEQGLGVADVTKEYMDLMSAAVSDAHTYPLFDETISNLISSGIAAGTVSVSNSGIRRGKEVALAADLFARLPLFPQASVKEILDIRHELEVRLRRFRGAMISFSDKIKDAAWDKDFSADAEQVFRRDVAPAIIDLEEEEKSSPYLRELFSRLAEKSVQIGSAVTASASLSALAIKMFNAPLTEVAALAILPAAAVGGAAYNAYTDWKRKQKELEQNNLFFYYKAGHFLEDGKYEYMSNKK